MPKQRQTQVPFKQVISDLLDNTRPFPPVHLHRFSDIDPADLASLRIAWPNINTERRVLLLEDLEDLADADTLVSFDDLARFALDDPDARARAVAIRLLWESEDTRLIPLFIRMMEKDPDDVVRAGAAGGLGLFIYLGELEAIPGEKKRTAEDALLKMYKGKDTPLVRRHVLESLGYSSRSEIPTLIEKAFSNEDKDWQSSALFAMGRSADERWESQVLASLESSEPEVRLEAVRAAGALSLASARPALLTLLENSAEEEQDWELRSVAIWSLSQIGGESVRATLEKLAEETEDEDEADFLDEALDNLNFTEGVQGLGMFDLEALADADHTLIIDPDEEEEDEKDEDSFYGSKN